MQVAEGKFDVAIISLPRPTRSMQPLRLYSSVPATPSPSARKPYWALKTWMIADEDGVIVRYGEAMKPSSNEPCANQSGIKA